MSPEVKLWRSVIIQAILDALSLFPETAYSNSKNSQEAKEWLIGGDINTISDYADTTPDYIRHLYSKLKSHRYLGMFETEELLKNAFIRPDKPTIYN